MLVSSFSHTRETNWLEQWFFKVKGAFLWLAFNVPIAGISSGPSPKLDFLLLSTRWRWQEAFFVLPHVSSSLPGFFPPGEKCELKLILLPTHMCTCTHTRAPLPQFSPLPLFSENWERPVLGSCVEFGIAHAAPQSFGVATRETHGNREEKIRETTMWFCLKFQQRETGTQRG